MKVYEYLAAGLPGPGDAAARSRRGRGDRDGRSAEELVAAAERELAVDSPEARQDRSKDAASHSWEARLEEIEQALG